MEKRHKYLDHAVLGYFLLILFAMIITNIFSGVIDIMILGKIIPGYLIEQSAMGIKFPMASGVGMALGSIAAGALGLFWGLYLVRSSKRQEIVELWKEKWSGN